MSLALAKCGPSHVWGTISPRAAAGLPFNPFWTTLLLCTPNSWGLSGSKENLSNAPVVFSEHEDIMKINFFASFQHQTWSLYLRQVYTSITYMHVCMLWFHLAMCQLKEILKWQQHSLLQPKLTVSSAKPRVCQIRLKELWDMPSLLCPDKKCPSGPYCFQTY